MNKSRKLTNDEKNNLVSELENIKDKYNNTKNIFESELVKYSIIEQLDNVVIYPHLLSKLKDEIIKQYYNSLISPGEMVGCIAATSIGAEQTQGSLNSFHSSGQIKKELTSGLDRMKELMSLSKEVKTPILNIYLNDNIKNSKLGYVGDNLNNENLAYVRYIAQTQFKCVKIEDVILSYVIEENPIRDQWWYESYTKLIEPLSDTCTVRLRLQLSPMKIFECKKSLKDIVNKIKKHINEEYVQIIYSDNYTSQIDIWVRDNELIDISQIPDISVDKKEKIELYIPDNVKKAKLFLTNVIYPTILKIIISGINNISRCYTEKYGNKYYIETRGGTLKSLIYSSVVDMTKSTSNNPREIYELFGIEAAYQFLVNEFKFIASQVDHRHLEMMIDWMCNKGQLDSVSRYGMDIVTVGPIAKAGFEQPVETFLNAATNAQSELIKGVNACVVTGNIPKIGTGSFSLLIDINKIKNSTPYYPKEEDNVIDTHIAEIIQYENTDNIEENFPDNMFGSDDNFDML
jgi:DNA-directed RNA polymerase II subunit RPB1